MEITPELTQNLQKLTPEVVQNYLTLNGWTYSQEYKEQSLREFTRNDEVIYLPNDISMADYQKRLLELISDVAKLDEYTDTFVYKDMLDMLTVRVDEDDINWNRYGIKSVIDSLETRISQLEIEVSNLQNRITDNE